MEWRFQRRAAIALASLAFGICAAGAGMAQQEPRGANAETPLATGVVLPDVTEKADPTQSFALYLPSRYSAEKRWPVIYAFDWAAHGELPVRLLAPAAEKRGYIVLGSNASHNGSARDALAAALALWQDSRARFWIDPKQSYTTGFSGASRNAFVFADRCGCIQGVIAVGAGLPPLAHKLESLSYVVFMTLGTYDFNYPELVSLEEELDSLHVPNRLWRFDGDHQWPPGEVMAEAVDWLHLEAMQQGRRAVDAAFVSDMRSRTLQRAQAGEKAGDWILAYEEYRKGAEEFKGLADTGEFSSRASALASSPDLRKAEKEEHEDLTKQQRMVGGVEEALTSLPSGSFELGRRMSDISAQADQVRDFAKRAKKPRDVRVARRAVNDIFATAFEAGLGQLRDQKAEPAEMYFQVAAEVAPESPAPPFELAKVYMKLGDKKRALRSLEAAVAKGMKKVSLLTDTAEFEPLRADERFQSLVKKLGGQP